jgi:RimJ/RimL family protein N-acetyltransferase
MTCRITAVVQRLCRHAFEEFGLVKITAHVHPHNQASAHVLEKCGFQEERFLRKHFLKGGQFVGSCWRWKEKHLTFRN